jgi:hypothetical protein
MEAASSAGVTNEDGSRTPTDSEGLRQESDRQVGGDIRAPSSDKATKYPAPRIGWRFWRLWQEGTTTARGLQTQLLSLVPPATIFWLPVVAWLDPSAERDWGYWAGLVAVTALTLKVSVRAGRTYIELRDHPGNVDGLRNLERRSEQLSVAYFVSSLVFFPLLAVFAASVASHTVSAPLLLATSGMWILWSLLGCNVRDDQSAACWPEFSEFEEQLRRPSSDASDIPFDGVEPDRKSSTQLMTLIQREMLRTVAAAQHPLRYQLVALGARPASPRPVPNWWRKQAGSTPVNDTYPRSSGAAVEEVRQDNARLLAELKLLRLFGFLRWAGDRLALTEPGFAQLAVPATMYLANLPQSASKSLAIAQGQLYDARYVECALTCGTTLEQFLKKAIERLDSNLDPKAGIDLATAKGMVMAWAQAKDSDKKDLVASSKLSALSSKHLEKVPIGRLLASLNVFVGPVPNAEADQRNKVLQKYLDERCVAKLQSLQTVGGRVFPLLNACKFLRDYFSHHQAGRVPGIASPAEVQYASHLLHLTRVAISMYCSDIQEVH